jgi:hypothetical protein
MPSSKEAKKQEQRTQIIIAIIGAVATIAVALIGSMANVLQPSKDATATIAQANHASDAQQKSSQVTLTFLNPTNDDLQLWVYSDLDEKMLDIVIPPGTSQTVELPPGSYHYIFARGHDFPKSDAFVRAGDILFSANKNLCFKSHSLEPCTASDYILALIERPWGLWVIIIPIFTIVVIIVRRFWMKTPDETKHI